MVAGRALTICNLYSITTNQGALVAKGSSIAIASSILSADGGWTAFIFFVVVDA
jgi:hypothetical protein